MNEQIKKNIEKNFLKIRGFDKWEDYDLIQASSKLDKNIRKELINTSIIETIKEISVHEKVVQNDN